jgi:hypothetical protein
MQAKKFDNLGYIVIDNVLSNPEELLQLSKEMTYYSSKTKNHVNQDGKYKWQGHRSDLISDEQKRKYFNEISIKLLNTFVDISEVKDISFNLEVRACFHYMTKEFALTDNSSWNHIDDDNLFAGVLYLNKKPKKNSGTVLYNGDEKIVIENKFNRMVMYRSDILHAPDVDSAYGTNLSNSRLTLAFFSRKISVSAAKFK